MWLRRYQKNPNRRVEPGELFSQGFARRLTPQLARRLAHRGRDWFRPRIWVALGVLVFLATSGLLATAAPIAWGQSPPLYPFPSPISALPRVDTDNPSIATGQVSLDGRVLFAIAAPALNPNEPSGNITPIRERIQGIEQTLHRIANSNFDPQTLTVTSEMDASSRLPIISVNDQYLMTVTTLDAQLQVQQPERWAERLTIIIKDALLRAHRERQPEYLSRHALISLGILLGVWLVSWAIASQQKRVLAQTEDLEKEIPAIPQRPSALGHAPSPAPTALQSRDLKRYHRHLLDLKRRFFQLMQVLLWGSGLFVILGLFPHTRWFQPLIFSTPLKLLAIALGTYAAIRISDIAIERFIGVLAQGSFIDPDASQRVSLRASTFSRVSKSVAGIIWVAIGVFMGLSVFGVNLVPLLAGAGLIGLAISFAAQSLIKDMINGILILFEDQYAVGDIITIGDASGLVENMNLRITQLRDSEGQLITIPNSTITVVRNLSKDWSRVDLSIDLAYGTDPDRALQVIRTLAQDLYQDPEWHSKMIDPPEVLGIEEVDYTGLLIRIWIKTQPLQQWAVAREFRRRLALVLEQEGLSIGVPQQSLWFHPSPEEEAESPAEKAFT